METVGTAVGPQLPFTKVKEVFRATFFSLLFDFQSQDFGGVFLYWSSVQDKGEEEMTGEMCKGRESEEK